MGNPEMKAEYVEKDTSKVEVISRCMLCGELSGVIVDAEGYDKWVAGEFVQDAFPRMPAEDREVLISGTHDECWDNMMGDDD